MADNGVVTAGGRLTDWVSLGVLASSVPRDAVDEAVAVTGKQARRRDGKLPPHVVVYLVMALALFADDDYEEAAARLTGTLASWGCWDEGWEVPTSGGITQARQRLGYEPMRELFSQVAVPVADELTRGAFLGRWRLMSIDGFEWDAPDTKENAAAFGYSGAGPDDPGRTAFPKARVVTVSECASHAVADAAIGGVAGKGAGEQSLARGLYRRLEEDWLLIADRNFYNWADWCYSQHGRGFRCGAAVAGQGGPHAAGPGTPARRVVLLGAGDPEGQRQGPGRAPRGGPGRGRPGRGPGPLRAGHRIRGLAIPDRDGDGKGEVIALITTITQMTAAPAPLLAQAYHQRWEHETGNAQLKTHLRGPGRVLRSKSPDMVRQEIYGYLLTHYAISALICRAATEADIDPDRVKFKQTVRIIRRQAAGPAAFPP